MSALESGVRIGNGLSALGAIRDTVKKSITDRMEESVRKIWENDKFFRATFGEGDLAHYLNTTAGENGMFTSALLREIFGLDKSMPDPQEFQRFCEKCHRKVGIAYRYRKIQEDGKPSQYWGGQFAIILNNVKTAKDAKYAAAMFKVGSFCSDCQPAVKLSEKTFWQPYEYALGRLQNMGRRREEERQKREKARTEKSAAELRLEAERKKFQSELEAAEELSALLDPDREAIRELIGPPVTHEVEVLSLADLVEEAQAPKVSEETPKPKTRKRAPRKAVAMT